YHEMEKAPDALESRTSGQRQAAREAGPIIRVAIAKGAKIVMPRLLADAACDEKTSRPGNLKGQWQRRRESVDYVVENTSVGALTVGAAGKQSEGDMAATSGPTTDHPRGLGAISELRAKWGWFVALGILMLIAGVIALGNELLATVVSVYYVGALMLVAGI